jgi:hypothetical protein
MQACQATEVQVFESGSAPEREPKTWRCRKVSTSLGKWTGESCCALLENEKLKKWRSNLVPIPRLLWNCFPKASSWGTVEKGLAIAMGLGNVGFSPESSTGSGLCYRCCSSKAQSPDTLLETKDPVPEGVPQESAGRVEYASLDGHSCRETMAWRRS